MTDEDFIIDPSSVPDKEVVSRIIENAAHVGADLDEATEYLEIAQRGKAVSSSLNSVEQWVGFAMTEVENIGHLAEALAKRLDSGSYNGEKNHTSKDNPLYNPLKAVKIDTSYFDKA